MLFSNVKALIIVLKQVTSLEVVFDVHSLKLKKENLANMVEDRHSHM